MRAYGVRAQPPKQEKFKPNPRIGPSGFVLVLDTETFVAAAQQLRVGVYQWRENGELREAGLFYDPASVTDEELGVICGYARDNDLEVRTDRAFVDEVFFGWAYELNAIIAAFNAPFDLSRLAIKHASARGSMRGGFTLRLTENEDYPNVRVKHLNARSALISFTARRGQRTPRSQRKKRKKVPTRRGFFVDVKTAASSVMGGSHSLRSLAELLDTPTKKLDMDDYRGPITPEYLRYAATDVQVTWECYEVVADRYDGYGLTGTLLPAIYSEASVGKACLREMGIERWRELQPDFPDSLIGTIMSTYYGGRSEVRIRREVRRVLYCDFLSMYPTVCSLMGLWRFVVAQGVEWDEDDAVTQEVRDFLHRVTLRDLQRQETWRELPALVQVKPAGDLFPVRAKYATVTEDGERTEDVQYTIGLNHLTSERPLWFSLADCVASKILTGAPPQVLSAIGFRPGPRQPTLKPIDLLGNPDFAIDPANDDFYRRLIDMRTGIRRRMREAREAGDDTLADLLDAQQLALKITANASSYGVFLELNIESFARLQELVCNGVEGEPFPAWEHNVEKPGSYFHPLLATLITGAARLVLTVAEQLAGREGIGWAFCDTDSMAFSSPPEMDEATFVARTKNVRSWFEPLHPYEDKTEPLFTVEDANYRLVKGKTSKEIEPLWCVAVSAKRHCLFNLDRRVRPVIRKGSGHGLGHLIAPYKEDDAPRSIPAPVVPLKDLDVERWEHDLWYRIVLGALSDRPTAVKTADLPGFGKPAVARYAATTPALLRWFKRWNKGKPYREQVRPFGFLLAYQADPSKGSDGTLPRAVSPYDLDREVALADCFDRETGRHVDRDELKTYTRALAQYHLNPEAKFLGADYTDAGTTLRRHVRASSVEHIGKEANRWEEQFFLGFDPEAQISYGQSPDDYARLRHEALLACRPFKIREIARTAGLSGSTVSAFLHGEGDGKTDVETLRAILDAIPKLEAEHRERDEEIASLLDRVRTRVAQDGLRPFAYWADVDSGNLGAVLAGRRPLSKTMRTKVERHLKTSDEDVEEP